jgi:hypothetical protein
VRWGPLSSEVEVLEDLIQAVASRYGFRATDYRAMWDGSEFDADRDPHQLIITVNDGRQITVTISGPALGTPWRPLHDIEHAFRELQRREKCADNDLD